MLDKIINRKFYKAMKQLEKDIAHYREMEERARQIFREETGKADRDGSDNYAEETAMFYANRRNALENFQMKLKQYLA